MHQNAKKVFVATMVFAFMFVSAGLPAQAEKKVSAGTVIKGKGLSTVYYLGEDGKRYVFPNGNTFFSWFDDFENVEEIEMDELTTYPLGGNVNYKPGAYLVKITTIPKVYAVSPGGTLRWVKTEELARQLYGEKWNLLVDDVPDSFFVNYEIGAAIESEEDYSPDVESETAPDIDSDLGLKKRIKVQAKKQALQAKRCNWLNNSITKLQKRLNRWGMEVPELGTDFLAQCVADKADNSKTVELCHIPKGDPEAATTIKVGRAAAAAHLAHGDKLGACAVNNDDSDDGTTDDNATSTELIISNLKVAVSKNGATVTWNTNLDSSALVMYAKTALADEVTTVMEKSGADAVKAHSIELTELSASTTYYYQVKSVDADDNEVISAEASFTTAAEVVADVTAPVISGVTVTPTASGAVVTWTTDEVADSAVDYASSSMSGAGVTPQTVSAEAEVLTHSLEISGLSASTTYYYIVKSVDASGNASASVEATFTTLE